MFAFSWNIVGGVCEVLNKKKPDKLNFLLPNKMFFPKTF